MKRFLLPGIIALAEDGRPDTDHGGTTLDGQEIIVGHTHRKSIETGAERRLQQLETTLQLREIAPDDRPVVGMGGDTHNAADPHVGHGRESGRIDVTLQLAQLPTAFGLLLRDVDFQQDVDDAAALGGFALDGLGEPGAVDRLNHTHERRDVLDLVGLQMTYHVPLDLLGQHLVLGAQLLRTALAEDTVPGVERLANGLGGVGLGDGDERHRFGQ